MSKKNHSKAKGVAKMARMEDLARRLCHADENNTVTPLLVVEGLDAQDYAPAFLVAYDILALALEAYGRMTEEEKARMEAEMWGDEPDSDDPVLSDNDVVDVEVPDEDEQPNVDSAEERPVGLIFHMPEDEPVTDDASVAEEVPVKEHELLSYSADLGEVKVSIPRSGMSFDLKVVLTD